MNIEDIDIIVGEDETNSEEVVLALKMFNDVGSIEPFLYRYDQIKRIGWKLKTLKENEA